MSGRVSIKEVLEYHRYTIPDYPVFEVELIHVKLEEVADTDIIVFDAIISAPRKPTQLHIPCDVYVKGGFFIKVCKFVFSILMI